MGVFIAFQSLASAPFLVLPMGKFIDAAFLGSEHISGWTWRIITRFVFLAVCMAIGVSLPFFKELVPLQSALTITLSAFILPALVRLSQGKSVSRMERIACVLIIIIALLVGWGLGLTFAIKSLVERVRDG